MTPEQNGLVERLRAILAAEPVLREVSMFGGRAFMVNEKLIVSAGKNGHLLVRVDPDEHDDLLGEPGAAQAEMGAGRTMGPGWIDVARDAISDDEALSRWVAAALSFTRSTP